MVNTDTSDFRERLSNLDIKGRRKWLFPKIIKGKYYKWRTWFSWGLLFLLFTGPWYKYQGHPVFMFNVIERKFILFGIPFWPQDLYLLALGVLTFIVFIIAFTSVFGRVFCGWACPQTIFMEMVFRKIEFWIEGSPAQQRKLKSQSWNKEKVIKTGGKNVIFWIISFLISNTFLAYIIGTDELIKIIKDPVGNHLAGFGAILVFTTVFYLVFARIRELVCIMICPYGRLQGVLLDSKSIVVAYDAGRGEPRGKLKRNLKDPNLGDCVDCGLCIDVCPTGIDIRNGTQMECVHCTACMDACDSVMKKISRPEKLIRYASEAEFKTGSKNKITTRVLGYTALWLILFATFVSAVSLRSDVQISLLRAKGSTYTKNGKGEVTNVFKLKLINKTFDKKRLTLKPSSEKIELKVLSDNIVINSGEQKTVLLLLIMTQENINDNVIEFRINVMDNGKIVNFVDGKFLGPAYDL